MSDWLDRRKAHWAQPPHRPHSTIREAHPRKGVLPGYRYFECMECGDRWAERATSSRESP